MKNRKKRIVVEIDAGLHAAFKVACYAKGITMKEAVESFVKGFPGKGRLSKNKK